MMIRSVFLFLTAALFLLSSCKEKTEKIEVDPAFGEFIQGYTSGIIPTGETISIELAQPFKKSTILSEDLLAFEPKIDGSLELVGTTRLIFRPSGKLASGKTYRGKLALSKLYADAADLGEFAFQFQTIEQNLSIYYDGYEVESPDDISKVTVTGVIRTADECELSELRQSLTAVQDGKNLDLSLAESGQRNFRFSITGVERKEKATTVEIAVSGNTFPKPGGEIEQLAIPSINDFTVMRVELRNEAEKRIDIYFSDPLQNQELSGLIIMEDIPDGDLSFKQSGNKVSMIFKDKLRGERLLKVFGEIKNSAGRSMGDPYTKTLVFDPENPSVRMVGNKFVIPAQSEGLLFPFESVSLNAVDVYITKVFNNNILQYLQTNDPGTNNSLYSVGRTVYKKHFDLRKVSGGNIYERHRYHIDLSEVINRDKAALYEVEIRFKKEYAALECIGEDGLAVSPFQDGWVEDQNYVEENYWSGYTYNWNERENPCHPSYYYRYRSKASRVVMATNLGAIAKAGGDDLLHLAVTDLKTSNPVGGAVVKVYDFQQQLMAEGKSDKQGFADLKCSRDPFAVVIKTKDDQTVLKVDEGSSLSLSKFDVEGKSIRDGLKGFIYTERGVWRPGDSLYIDFILRDEAEKLPDNHPVKMQFFNSRGQLSDTQMSTGGLNGFYHFETATSQDDPTGDYRLEISVGNRKFTKRIPIETIKPNRLKIDLEVDQEASTGKALKASLSAAWLHGATASGLKADVSMRLSSTKTSFDRFRGFHFDNLLESRVSRVSEKVFEGTLNDDGTKTISVPMSDRGKNASGKLKAYFETKVYEPGGGFSVDYYNATISPYSSYVGMKAPEGDLWGGALETGKKHLIELAGVSESGDPENKNVELSVYKVDRRWWFDRYSGDDYNYLNTSSYRRLIQETVSLKDGRGKVELNIAKENWGRYLIRLEDKESGHSAARFVFFDWPYWMRANRTEGEAATILGFSSDKETYAPGEAIKVSFPSPNRGRALVTVENGTSVLFKEWVETSEGETKIEIPVTGEMAPNAYVHISLIQPHDQTVNDRPIRSFGVIPINVENPATILHPEISLPKVLRPEEPYTVKVSEENGKPMTYTLAVVDEGLLDLTNFKTPRPHDYFYAHEALGVRTWDYYDQVVSAFGLSNQDILSIGGDEEAPDPSEQKARRFKPVVRHLGPFTLAANAKAQHVIQMPNYIGAVRLMLVAGEGEAFGHAEKSVPVRSELMVLGTLPRVFGPGETVSLPVNVFAMEDGVKDVSVSVKTNELLSPIGELSKSVKFDKPGEQMVYFEFKTPLIEGVAEVSIEAVSGGKKSTYEAEVQLRSPNPVYSTVKEFVVEPGKTWNGKIEYFGIDGTNSATMEVSKLPAIRLEKRLGYLMGYPHGCVEQTTSKAFPQLYLKHFISLSANQQSEIADNVDYALRRLLKFQLGDGGFSYWPGSNNVSDWGTCYAGHFMLSAEKSGYALPSGIKRKWLNHQKRRANNWRSQNETYYDYSQRTQAYRLYTLALAGEPEYGAMNSLRELNGLTVSAKWILGLAYAKAGRSKEAKSLIQTLPKNIDDYTELGYSYGSSTRDEAFVLMTLQELGETKEAAKMARKLAKRLGSESFYSTQTTAMTLLALADYLGDYRDDGLVFELNSNPVETGKPLYLQSFDETDGGKSLSLTNKSEQAQYLTMTTTGRPAEGKEVKRNDNLRMKVKYLNDNFEPIDHRNLSKGTDLMVEIILTNPRNKHLQEMALTHGVASGWEILNSRLSEMSDASSAKPEYQDIRDAKILTYFDLAPNQTVRFYARVNASYSGRFYLPSIVCNAMYDESIIAVEPGEWVEVK